MFRLRCSYPNPEQAAWMAVTCAWCEYNLSSSNKRYDRFSDTAYLRSTQRLWSCNMLTRPDRPAPQLFLRVSPTRKMGMGEEERYTILVGRNVSPSLLQYAARRIKDGSSEM